MQNTVFRHFLYKKKAKKAGNERVKVENGRKKVEDKWRITPVLRHLPLTYSLDYMMFNIKIVEGRR